MSSEKEKPESSVASDGSAPGPSGIDPPDDPRLVGIVPWSVGKHTQYPVRALRGRSDDYIEGPDGVARKELYMVDSEDWQYLTDKYGIQTVLGFHTNDQIQTWSDDLQAYRRSQSEGIQPLVHND